MGERTHTTDKAKSGTKKTWGLVIAGTAVLLLAAGVMLQITRPTSAFPEDGTAAGGKSAPAGKAATSDHGQGQRQGQGQKTRYVARVGKEHISYEELADECINRHGKEILDNLINRKIIQQACDNLGIEVSVAEVNKAIDKQAKDLGLTSDQLLSMTEAERNISPMQFRRDIVWPMLALRKLAGEDVKVTDEDLKKAFVRNYGERVIAKAIVLDNPRRAREVWEKAKESPEDFERLATEHSVDPSSKHLGGVVPPIQRYAGQDAVETAAFKLKKGEISPVIQVGLKHYIIIKCEGRTDPTVKDLSEVRDILINELKEEKIHMAVAKVFEKLKSEARVDNYVSGESTGEKRPAATSKTAAAHGTVKQTGGTARGSARQIPDHEPSLAPARSAPAAKAGGKTTSERPPAQVPADE